MVNSLPTTQLTRVQSLDWEDSPEEEMVTHSCILAWRILWTEEFGGLQSMGSQTVGHNLVIEQQHIYKWPISNWKKHSASWVNREMQIQPQFAAVSPYPLGELGLKSVIIAQGDEEVEKLEPDMLLVGMEMVKSLWRTLIVPQRVKHSIILLLLLLSRFSCVRLCATP